MLLSSRGSTQRQWKSKGGVGAQLVLQLLQRKANWHAQQARNTRLLLARRRPFKHSPCRQLTCGLMLTRLKVSSMAFWLSLWLAAGAWAGGEAQSLGRR